MERPVTKSIGTPAEELDTPALVIDLDALDRNIETLHSLFRAGPVTLRPHVGAHRCPAVARRQLAAGGAGGICVAGLGEAEVFVHYGFPDIVIAAPVVTPSKIVRLCSLARAASITITVDSADNVQALSAAALAAGVTLDARVALRPAPDCWGVAPGQPALALARAVDRASGLRFAGLSSSAVLRSAGAGASGAFVRRMLEARDLLEKEGLQVRTVSLACDEGYGDAAASGVSELVPGAYALSDAAHAAACPEFQPALRVLATVASRPESGLGLLDLGQKALPADTGLPLIDGLPGAEITRMNAEHGFLVLDEQARSTVDLGARVWVVPRNAGDCMNQFDRVNAVRDGRLQAVWPVAARGHYR